MLLAMVTLLLGRLALAHAEQPADWVGGSSHSVAMEATTAVGVETGLEGEPSCHHGHGEFALPQGVPRPDRHDMEPEEILTATTTPTTLPIPVPIATLQYWPAKPGLPVYLLTQRLRL